MTVNPEDHLGLAYSIASKWRCSEFKFPREERISVAMLALVQAAKKFNPERGAKFSTYATFAMQHELSNYQKTHANPGIRLPDKPLKGVPIGKAFSISETFANSKYAADQGTAHISEQIENQETLEGVFSRCTDFQAKILKELLNHKPQKEIAEILGCSNQWVSTNYNQIIFRERRALQEEGNNE